ncbi:hypothetical protein [Nocardia sp. XZ_19_385]|nr:hypothetical protein [Nocardia sp. XZ_19_385]
MMRTDFTEYVALQRQALRPTVSDTEMDQYFAQQAAISQRWKIGPHAQHWEYLSDAHHDWQQAPKTMERFLHGVVYDCIDNGDASGVTDIQLRSQAQARDLTEPQRQQPRPERGR